ncbi:MAG: 23S rRNA (adenine(2503)-C(2))-methyltransferase RlmN, partial [Bacteroidota bacterium]
MPDQRTILSGAERADLARELASMGEAPFRARQLWHWIYHRGAREFEAMTTVPRRLRHGLAERFTLERPGVR